MGEEQAKAQSTTDVAYEYACTFAKKAKTVVHVAWIPLLIWIGSSTNDASVMQIILPPM